MPDNYFIADQFDMLSKLMDIHGENAFKSKSYATAAFNIEKLTVSLETTPPSQFASLKGIGDSAAKKIEEILETGKLQALTDLIQKTPPGIIEMMSIKGIGPKKIATIWKEMEIETLGELLYACNENRLMMYKGFGEKTQEKVKEAIQFYNKNKGHFLYAEVEGYALQLLPLLQKQFTDHAIEYTGDFKKQNPVISKLELITTVALHSLEIFFTSLSYQLVSKTEKEISFVGPENIVIVCTNTSKEDFGTTLFIHNGSETFLDYWQQCFGTLKNMPHENDLFQAANLPFIPAFMREHPQVIERAKKNTLPTVIQPNDIRGMIHNHSNWSDGVHTIEAMAKACIEKGWEYLVISDHSKTAFYANGLQEDRIKAQHQYIDELNKQLHPFKIFKSIESDILNDGSLDYSNEVLSSFDLVIASIHSNLYMNQEKAMMRLMNAIENPYTTILGHMTGRLLLSRNGYPIDHQAIIDACVANDVVIELNAHPRRLDIDWSWINLALEKGALLSIDPDAHHIDGFNDVRFGVLAAQKAGLTSASNLSSFTLPALEDFIRSRKSKKQIN